MQAAQEPESSSNSNGKLANATQLDALEGNAKVCTICGSSKSSSSALLDLTANSVMQRRLSRDWKLSVSGISQRYLASISLHRCTIAGRHSQDNTASHMRRVRLQAEHALGGNTHADAAAAAPDRHGEITG